MAPLDAFQQRVVDQKWDSKVVVVAGPGTGKSYTAALRVAHIVSLFQSDELHAESSVLCLTFTNAATGVTKERLQEQGVNAGVEVKTIDKWCFQILSRAGLGVAFEAGDYDDSIKEVIDGLRKGDFLDLIQVIEHIVIDESQDIYGVRLELLELILEMKLIRGWTVLGDPAQTIYEYGEENSSGSFLSRLISENSFDEYFRLEIDHRSKNDRIREVRVSGGGLRKEAPSDVEIDAVWRDYLDNPLLSVTELMAAASAYNKSDQSVGVLVRTNREVLELSMRLSALGIEHRCASRRSEFRIPSWVADLDQVKSKDEALASIPSFVDTAKFSIAIERWCHGGAVKQLSLERLSRDLLNRNIPEEFLRTDPHRLSLSTVHMAKGLEFDKVLVGLERKVGERELEEARVLFVAVTRSQESLLRLAVAGLTKNSRLNRTKTRWVDIAFRGKANFATSVEVKMSDFAFYRTSAQLKVGDEVEIRRVGNLENGLPRYAAFCVSDERPFAELKQDFCLDVSREWNKDLPMKLTGLRVSTQSCIAVPRQIQGNWTEEFLAKVPVAVGMVHQERMEAQ
jgi:superfamily I DNA/RNA helicase